MKATISIIVFMGLVLSNPASANKFEISKQPLVKAVGLYTALDSSTGYEQIYYRSGFKKKIQLTSTESDKASPQWGPSGVTYYFYDRVENKILTCVGRLFYYLESSDDTNNQLQMGCVASDSSATPSIIEGYPLTGFGDGPTSVEEYHVADGTDLSYDYNGTIHEAYPIIVVSDSGDTIILHDDQANLGSTDYEDGFVTYYDGDSTGDIDTGWSSSTNDDVNWDGTIACPKCVGNKPGNSNGDNKPGGSGSSGSGSTDGSDAGDTNVDTDQTVETSQQADQSTDVSNGNQNGSSASVNQSGDTSAANTVNVNVTVEVDSTNTNTATSASASDFSGSVDSSSSNEEATTTTPDSTDTSASVSSPTPDINADTSVPDAGGMQMVGGGGCSLSPLAPANSSSAMSALLSLSAFFGALWARKHAYGKGL